MKKYSTKFVSIILSLILIISSLPLTVFAADDSLTLNPSATKEVYSDGAYLGRGVAVSGNKVIFPEQGFVNMEHAEFTFNGSVSGSTATGTFSSKTLGYLLYLNLEKADNNNNRIPLSTNEVQLKITKDTGSNIANTFNIYDTNQSRYLYFHDDNGSSYYAFNRSTYLNNGTNSFTLLVQNEKDETSGIEGYKIVTDISEIKNGEKFLIAHPSKYNSDGSAADGADWYVVFPSKTLNAQFSVAKVYTSMPASKAKRLQNGSFEYKADGTEYDGGAISQPKTYEIQAWDTTSIENLSELFTKDTNAHMAPSDSSKKYIPDGTYAAELNAEEPGTLYQIVNTVPSSTYLWGLDHRGRTGTDTMALVIGPNQEIKPSKNSGKTGVDVGGTTDTIRKQYGKDQFMQIVSWAETQGGIELLHDYSDSSGHYGRNTTDKKLQSITVYSTPFDINGSFKDIEDGTSPFSLVPTDEHTEEWHIWIMISGSGDWSSYGSNDKTIDAGKSIINDYGNVYSTVLNDEKLRQFFYNVPAGQTESMFAFVPIDTADEHRSAKSNGTCGNLVDDINFEVFNSFTASSTDHGSGSVSNTNKGEDFKGEDDITKLHPISIYTHDNSTQNLVARISAENIKDDVTFAGVYLTTQDKNGDSQTVFMPRKSHEIVESDLKDKWVTDSDNENLETATVEIDGKSLTVTRLKSDDGTYGYDIPDGYWFKREDSTGNVVYITQLKNVTGAVDAHFIFLKSPMVTYDANSDGTAEHQYKISEDNTSNIYSFKPTESQEDGTVEYIDPVTSHNPETPADGWKFIGWKLFDDDGVVTDAEGNDLILSGTNAIACNTKAPSDAASVRRFIVADGKTAAEAFDNGTDVTEDGNKVIGKEWTLKDGVSAVYEKESEALTLVGQWRYRNTFIPEYQETVSSDFVQGETGGTVSLTTAKSDSNYYEVGENGTKSYYAESEEQIVATAKSNDYYTFIGWYDSDGNVVTTNPELIVNQVKGVIGEYHARFQKTGVAVNFYYLEYNENTKSYEYKVYDSGKYTQYLNKRDTAKQPTNDSKSVKTWYTSPTQLGADTAYDFSTPVTKNTDLYAAPTFTFNYLNQFQFAEPWRMITYATLKYDGKYIDMKSDPDVSDYKVYILKASSVNEAKPTSADIKADSNTLVVSKDESGIMFDGTTGVGAKFNRIGTKYNNLHIYDMKTPVWVTFEFTYRGITYTANVKDRSLYNNIDTYMKTTGQQWYTEYSSEQEAVLTSIKNMYDATAAYGITEATNYKSSAAVSADVKTAVKAPEEDYAFTSSTAIRNIEPWGFKYSFSVNDKALSEYDDYGVVVLSGADSAPTASELVNNENAVMYSKSGNNIYSVDGDVNTAVAYHVNGITIANYDKDTYAVFFVKDSSGYHYSAVVTNSYKSIASADTSDSKAVSTAILDYAEKYRAYVDAISKKNN